MAGSLHPPFSLFLPEENEKTGRARSKREKEGYGDDAGARLNDRRSRNDFPRAIKLSGGCPSPNGPAPLFAAAPWWLRRNCVYRSLKNPFLKKKKVYRRKNGRPSIFFNSQGAAAKRGGSPFDNLQNPRSNYAAGKRHAYPEEAPFARPLVPRPPAGAVLPFLFWTVHGPFSLFLLEGKEKMGGAMNQPSLVSNPPARRASISPASARGPLSADTDSTHRTLVTGALGRVQHPVGDLPAVGEAVVSHGKYLRAVPGAQAAANAAFIYCRVHRVSPILKKICPVPEERGGKASVPHFFIFSPLGLV